MDKRKAALIVLDEIDNKAPTTINWNFKEQWLNAIMSGLIEVEKIEIPGAATPRKSKK